MSTRMDPLRYPRVELQADDRGDAALKVAYSNLAERLEIERQYVALLSQHYSGMNELLSETKDALEAIVDRLRRAESDIALDRTRSTIGDCWPEDTHGSDLAPDDVIAAALKAFRTCEIQLTTSKVPLHLSNFHSPESFGCWTGPGLLSSFGIDLEKLRCAGLNSIEVEFGESLVGPLQECVWFLSGENLQPLATTAVSWPTRGTVRLEFSGTPGRTGDLFLLTSSTRRKRPDPRHRGVAIVTMRFLA
jgi:hypothetical protein